MLCGLLKSIRTLSKTWVTYSAKSRDTVPAHLPESFSSHIGLDLDLEDERDGVL